MTTKRSSMAVSLRDVAADAGVSVSTVSRYLSGQLNLRTDTERRVLASMEHLGYQRDVRAAAASRPAAAGIVGLIVPQIGNSYFSRIAAAVLEAAARHGMSVLIASTENSRRQQLNCVELLASRDVDGLVYAGSYASNPALARVAAGGMPVVVIDEEMVGIRLVDTVLVDDYSGAYQATTYLTTLGHTRIALVTGPAELHSVRERTRGYRDALLRCGLDPDDQVQLSGTFDEEFGVAALSHLLSSPQVPTAVFAASDAIALGMLTAASTYGISIPERLSLVGFDDVPAASLVTPRLTTVRTPVDHMANMAISLLIDRVSDPARPARTAVTPVSLITGGSAGPVFPEVTDAPGRVA